jgi:hypothetical protein
MDSVAKNEQFLRDLVKLKKKEAVLKLRSATEDECKSVIELLLNAESHLDSKALKTCKGQVICAALKKLKKVSRKVLIKLFAKSFKQVISLIALMLLNLFENSLNKIYSHQDV